MKNDLDYMPSNLSKAFKINEPVNVAIHGTTLGGMVRVIHSDATVSVEIVTRGVHEKCTYRVTADKLTLIHN